MKDKGTAALPASKIEAATTGNIEAEWIQAARAGDREAFGRLVESHGDAAMAAARYMTGDPEDAADIVQDSFLRAWRSLAGFSGSASFRTWLLVIVANAARSLSAHRKAKKRTAPGFRIHGGADEEPLEIADPDPRGRPAELALRRERKEAIEEAIAGLDEESRALVVMRDLLGQSYESIAAARGIPLGTVKSKIHRARLELRDRLDGKV